MAVVIAGELVLDRNETAALVRNMAHPNIETLRCRDEFLNNKDDIAFSFSDEGIIAECGSIAFLKEKQELQEIYWQCDLKEAFNDSKDRAE